MILQPRQLKYPKHFRGKMKGISTSCNEVEFGDFAIKALDRGWITEKQIEAARKTIIHHTKKQGKLWIRIFPDKPYTKKPAEVRMGGGKGDVAGYVAVVKPGRILFEVGGLDEGVALKALKAETYKLPIKTKIISKE